MFYDGFGVWQRMSAGVASQPIIAIVGEIRDAFCAMIMVCAKSVLDLTSFNTHSYAFLSGPIKVRARAEGIPRVPPITTRVEANSVLIGLDLAKLAFLYSKTEKTGRQIDAAVGKPYRPLLANRKISSKTPRFHRGGKSKSRSSPNAASPYKRKKIILRPPAAGLISDR